VARYDVYVSPEGNGYVVDLQADLFDDYGTRVVVPLLPPDVAPKPVVRLNPIFAIKGDPFSLHPHLIATLPATVLGRPVGSLSREDYTIGRAFDMMLNGFWRLKSPSRPQ